MGTSSRWTASDTAAWRRARDVAADDDSTTDDVVDAVADALYDDDPALREPPSTEPLFDWEPPARLPRRPGGGADGPGGGGGMPGVAGAARPGGSDAGGTGRRTRTQVVKGASRAGAAIGAAHAFRQGNAERLREDYGLDIDELSRMSARERADRILDAIVGDSGSPDDATLRRLLVAQLRRYDDDDAPAPDAAIRDFIGDYVTSLGVRELAGGMADELTNEKVESIETDFRDLVDVRASQLDVPSGGTFSKRELEVLAETMVKETVAVLRKMVEEAQ